MTETATVPSETATTTRNAASSRARSERGIRSTTAAPSRSFAETVADASNGLNEPRGIRIVVELPAEVRDVDVDQVVVADEVGAPDIVEERLADDDDARVAREDGQDVELGRRQRSRLPVHGD